MGTIILYKLIRVIKRSVANDYLTERIITKLKLIFYQQSNELYRCSQVDIRLNDYFGQRILIMTLDLCQEIINRSLK